MIRQLDERIRRHLAGIRMAFRGVITLVKSAGSVQLVQLDGVSGEILQDAELFQQYGCTSNPPAGSMAIVLPIGGKTAHGIIIATEHGNYRLKNLAPGETALYDDLGQSVHLTRNGIVVDGAGKPITVQNTPHVDFNTPIVNTSGDLRVGGSIIAQHDITDNAATAPKTMSGMRIVYNGHTHADPQGGSVSTTVSQM